MAARVTDDDCLRCGERRQPASPYCRACGADVCATCGFLHGRGGRCDPDLAAEPKGCATCGAYPPPAPGRACPVCRTINEG